MVIPAHNESASLGRLFDALEREQPESELIVVNDGSTDSTAEIASGRGARVLSHPYRMGNGAAVKTGARAASGEILVFMDADGQHDPADIPRLLAKLDEGYGMAVRERQADISGFAFI